MSFYTTEEQITELFSKCGDLKRVVMGLDKVKRVSLKSEFFIRAFLEPIVSKITEIIFRPHVGFVLLSTSPGTQRQTQCAGSMAHVWTIELSDVIGIAVLLVSILFSLKIIKNVY